MQPSNNILDAIRQNAFTASDPATKYNNAMEALRTLHATYDMVKRIQDLTQEVSLAVETTIPNLLDLAQGTGRLAHVEDTIAILWEATMEIRGAVLPKRVLTLECVIVDKLKNMRPDIKCEKALTLINQLMTAFHNIDPFPQSPFI